MRHGENTCTGSVAVRVARLPSSLLPWSRLRMSGTGVEVEAEEPGIQVEEGEGELDGWITRPAR
jgi:hypothetical protein